MGNVGKTARYLTIFITLIFCLLNSCSIQEDFSNCNNDEEDFLLYIKVIDIVTGKDITESGEIDNAYLYLFDYNQNFVKTYEISAAQIARREPIVFKHDELDRAIISAWGNLGEEINISNPQIGSQIKELAVSLLKNPEATDYNISPNDFFFGSKKIDEHSHTNHIEEVVLTQKNAKLHITVRGLDDRNADNYYFSMTQKHNGYDFTGKPFEKNSKIKQRGIFNNRMDYVSPYPYLMIHSPNTEQSTEENSTQITLYLETNGETQEIVSTNKDSSGNYIVLESGYTTNVFIDTSISGDINIQIQVTPWDEIYQWSEF